MVLGAGRCHIRWIVRGRGDADQDPWQCSILSLCNARNQIVSVVDSLIRFHRPRRSNIPPPSHLLVLAYPARTSRYLCRIASLADGREKKEKRREQHMELGGAICIWLQLQHSVTNILANITISVFFLPRPWHHHTLARLLTRPAGQ